MRIIEPSADFMFPEDFKGDTKFPYLKRLERIARTCYQSEGNICDGSDKKLIQKLLNKKHYPMFDHAHISVIALCDRGVSHEIVRHRLAAYAQESTRYCNYSKDKFSGHVTFIKPCFFPDIQLGTFGLDDVRCNANDYTENSYHWLKAMLAAEDRYLRMVGNGCSPQEARSVLPNSLKTSIVMTYDFTVWRHFFQLRTAHAAHPQMRQIIRPLLQKFKANIPLIFDDINYEEV
jgi:thymidylate synthase (FAD)